MHHVSQVALLLPFPVGAFSLSCLVNSCGTSKRCSRAFSPETEKHDGMGATASFEAKFDVANRIFHREPQFF